MKIALFNTSDTGGGAARAAHRLHRALLSAGADCRMFVAQKNSDEYQIHGPTGSLDKLKLIYKQQRENLNLRNYPGRDKNIFFSPGLHATSLHIKQIQDFNPDVIHAHWINGGFLNIKSLARFQKPVVWSLHDMWPFTGGCHYAGDCLAYQKACGNCPALQSNRTNDLSARILKSKLKWIQNIPGLTIVGLSNWLTTLAISSQLFKGLRIEHLPNPIDTSVYKPIAKKAARQILNLPLNKKIILFGAISATSDSRKGYVELIEALGKIKGQNVEAIVFGASHPEISPPLDIKFHFTGKLYDNSSLSLLYNAADLTVVPSKQENLSNTIMESHSCGTPVVAFHIGGNSDMIEHKKNGYLSKPEDTTDLARGINWILAGNRALMLGKEARKNTLFRFDSNIVANQYLNLYQSL